METGTSPTSEAGAPGFGDSGSVREEAKQTVHEAVGAVRREAEEVIDSLKHQAQSVIDEQKAIAAGKIDGIAQALRKASEELAAQHNTSMAGLVRRTAEGVETMAERVRAENMGDLYRRAEDFSRRNPSVVLGGTAVAAFLLARFIRASERRAPEQSYDQPGYGQSYEAEDYLEFDEGVGEVGGPYR